MFSPNFSGFLRDPKYIVVRSTKSGDFDKTCAWFCNKKSKVSAHYLIGRAGELAQLVPLNRCAWSGIHNRDSIAIGLVSWGPLVLRDGRYFSALYGNEVPENEVRDEQNGGYRYWHAFTKAQLAKLDEVTARFPGVPVETLGPESS